MKSQFRLLYFALGLMVLVSLTGFRSSNTNLDVDAKALLCEETATLFRSARAVISKGQALINDASKGDKGLTGDKVVAEAKENFKKATGEAFAMGEAGSLRGQAHKALFSAIKKVMNQAQPLINEKGKGFKGFLPAIFAKQVADNFSLEMDGKMFIKLTAPKSYVRNRANRPDTWESGVIENKFKTDGWEKNKTFFETSDHKGKPAFRLLIPEYYKDSCLKCHGDPKGELDITGGKKEGGKLGELGGAISVVIYN